MTQTNSDNYVFPMVKPRLKYPDAEALRRGRGFSCGEIDGAGASVQDVKGVGLPIDRMRRSVHDFNVKALRELLGKPGKEKAARKVKAKPIAKTSVGKRQEKAEKKKGEKKKDK